MKTRTTQTSKCPKCGAESEKVLTSFDRVFPLPVIHVTRFQCPNAGCKQDDGRKYWEVTE